jgi:uncharacterized protein (DUF58 family)
LATVEHRLSVTARGLVALVLTPVSAVAGLLVGAEELVLLAIALATLLVGGLVQSAVRARRAQSNWRVAMALPAGDVEMGSDLTMTVTLTASRGGGSVPVWVEDPTWCWERVQRPGKAPRPNPSLALRVPLLLDGAVTAFASAVPTEFRGVFVQRGLRLWCFDTVGLFSRLVGTGPSATVSVYPVPTPVALSTEALRGEPGSEDHQLIAPEGPKRRDNLGDFSGLRPYVPGDRLRLVYWPALARTGELMVRDFEDTGPRHLYLHADVRWQVGLEGCERILATAAAVGLEALALGSIVELSTSSGERIAVGPGPHGPLAFLRAIAAIDAFGGPTAIHGGAPTLSTAPIVITTPQGVASLPGALGLAHIALAP